MSKNAIEPSATILNTELQNIHTWLQLNKLSLKIEKTKCMLFTAVNKPINYPSLHINGTAREFFNNFVFLGIIFNKYMKWDGHVDKIAHTISKTIGILKKLKHTLPLHTLKIIYNSLINSHLHYGLLCWGYRTNRLLKLQKKALRIITNSAELKYNAHTQPLFKKINYYQ